MAACRPSTSWWWRATQPFPAHVNQQAPSKSAGSPAASATHSPHPVCARPLAVDRCRLAGPEWLSLAPAPIHPPSGLSSAPQSAASLASCASQAGREQGRGCGWRGLGPKAAASPGPGTRWTPRGRRALSLPRPSLAGAPSHTKRHSCGSARYAFDSAHPRRRKSLPIGVAMSYGPGTL